MVADAKGEESWRALEARTGIPVSSLFRYANGEREPAEAETLMKLRDCLGIPLEAWVEPAVEPPRHLPQPPESPGEASR